MLKQATVHFKTKLDDKESKEITLLEAYKIYTEEAKAGGMPKMLLKTYHPPTGKFNWQTPVSFKPIPDISKVLTLVVSVEKEGFPPQAEIVVDTVTKILVKTNNLVTSIAAGGLLNLFGGTKLEVGFMIDDKLEFKKLVRVYDTLEELKKIGNKDPKPEEKPKGKRGRPAAKKAEVAAPAVPNYEVVKLETRDGSLFICDHLVMK